MMNQAAYNLHMFRYDLAQTFNNWDASSFLLTHRTIQVHIPQPASKQQANFHIGLICIPDAHAVVGYDCPHGMVTCIVPLLLAQLQHLLQLLAQMPVSFCHKGQLAEFPNCM